MPYHKWYTSDLHLGHKNIISFDGRPFDSLDEMQSVIIKNWNERVKKSDDVYILGDMFWDNKLAPIILPQLKGQKHLILGNHDRINTCMEQEFVEITHYKEVKDGGHKVVLCHYPIAHWKNCDYGTIHLYGHIHAARDSRPFSEYMEFMRRRGFPYECYNVGCMLHNYSPVTLGELRREI